METHPEGTNFPSFKFWLCRVFAGAHRLSCPAAHGISVPRPGTEPRPLHRKERNLNHWTTRKSHRPCFWLLQLNSGAPGRLTRGLSLYESPVTFNTRVWKEGWRRGIEGERKEAGEGGKRRIHFFSPSHRAQMSSSIPNHPRLPGTQDKIRGPSSVP